MRCTHVMVIPYRVKKGRKEICLITTRGSGSWIVPKGWREHHLPDPQLALQEAWEEAGLKGQIKQKTCNVASLPVVNGGAARGYRIYLMEVNQEKSRWPETGERKRRWVPVTKLDDYIDCKPLRKTIEACAI